MNNKERNLVIFAAIAFFAVIAWQGGFFSIFDPGAAAPLTSQIELNTGHVYEGTPTVIEGETITANWTGEWLNRNHSPYGGDNIAGLWFLDGEYVELTGGGIQSIGTTYCSATTTIGCVVEQQWNWQTLPIAATLPIQGGTTPVNGTTSIDTTGLEKGTHQLAVKVYSINGSLNNVSMFTCGTINGVCCPLQTVSQGFPCPGIFGTTQQKAKSSLPRCTPTSIPEINPNKTFYNCAGIQDCGSCGSWCCANWQGVDPCYNWGSDKYVLCDNSGDSYKVWSGWGELTTTVEQTQETVMASAISSATTVAIAEFEVVEQCPNQCCVNEPGYKDKLCTQDNYICSNGACVFEKTVCPTECCESDYRYFDLVCENYELQGYGIIDPECVSGQCVSTIVVQCNQTTDCTPPPCAGVTVSCSNHTCIYEGNCITQPQVLNIWSQIAQSWTEFWQWLLGLFAW